ncbi:DUF3558 domain-containing protein [Rhodococcus opacus]|nr:DUF3558 domain-containing protein [Rhodococcus opacus]RZL79125.1 MAG: DUF3558 domain-containing protein [Rhodococcus sp. (in: high G+C Gram-positive bacteria)]
MNRPRRASLLVLAASSILMTAGCSQTTEGDPGAEPAPDITFHPCDAMPAEAIQGLGLDVRPPDRRDHDNPKSLGCGYLSNDPEYGLTIAARPDTLDEVKSDDRFNVLNETEIGGRRALLSDFRGGSACTVSVAIEPGILEFMIGYSELEDFATVDAACDQATKVATTLAPYFPDNL